MAKKQSKKEREVLVDVEESIGGVERFVEENKKSISIIVGGIVAVVLAYLAYTNFYVQPRQEEASKAMWKAQDYFAKDSLRLSLEGDGEYPGFLDIIEDYSGTKAANLSHYYAGVAYLHMGEFEESIRYMDDFDGTGDYFGTMQKGVIGDAFMELDQEEEALEYYEKAARVTNNEFITPIFLMKAALLREDRGDHKKALGHYREIKEEYNESREASDINKYIARVEAKMNK